MLLGNVSCGTAFGPDNPWFFFPSCRCISIPLSMLGPSPRGFRKHLVRSETRRRHLCRS
jgi:hypothetical protein